MTTNERAEATLADLGRLMRQRRLLIAVTTVICVAAALVYSVLQKPTYDASASLSVRDPAQDLSILGVASVSNQTPNAQASAHVVQVTRPAVLRAVQSDLKNSQTLDQIKRMVQVSVDPSSNLVIIDAHAPTAVRAAAVANSLARNDVRLTTQEERRRFSVAAQRLANRISTTRDATTRLAYQDQLARLQSLSSVAQPVQIEAPATAPGAPSSPKPVRNTLAALLIGFLLGVFLAYARRGFDHKLQGPDEVEEHLPQPVLGYIRNAALGYAPAGENENGALSDTDEESFRILRQNVQYLDADSPVRSIVVTSPMAEEGKSTVASALATAYATAGKRVILLECDLRRPVLARRLGLKEAPGLTDYLTRNAEPRDVLQTFSVPAAVSRNGRRPSDALGGADESQFACVTAGTSSPRPAELLASRRFVNLLSEVASVYDSVILDSTPLLSVADTLDLIPHASAVLMCVRMEQTTRNQARAAHAALEHLPRKPTGIVVTGLPEKGRGYGGYYYPPYAVVDESSR